MLVLTRDLSANEIVITAPNGDMIVIKLLTAKGQKIRLGFTAPVAYSIQRREIQELIDQEKRNGR